jgi:hypothetical protein
MTTTIAQPTSIDSGAMYMVTNLSDNPLPFPLKWARIDYTPAPHMTKMVPFDVVALFFGDPRSRPGVKQKFQDSTGAGEIPTREEEVARLSVRYGVYEQGMQDIVGHATAIAKEGRGHYPPDCSIKTLAQEEVIPPLYDPQGEFTYTFTPQKQESNDPATLFNQLQKQINTLQDAQERLSRQQQQDDVVADEPYPLDIPDFMNRIKPDGGEEPIQDR